MTSNDSEWASLFAAIGEQLSPAAQKAVEVFKETVRRSIRRVASTGASDLLIKATTIPIVKMAYTQLLYKLQIPYEEPSPDFVEHVIDSIVDEVRSRKGHA